MKLRIAIVEYETLFNGKKKTFAVQRRVFPFIWVTAIHCDTIGQARYAMQSYKGRELDKVLRVIE